MIARVITYAKARYYEVRAQRAHLTYVRCAKKAEVFFARLRNWGAL